MLLLHCGERRSKRGRPPRRWRDEGALQLLHFTFQLLDLVVKLAALRQGAADFAQNVLV